MLKSEEYYEKVLGINVRPRKKDANYSTKSFDNPIIHREITGDNIYVKLDMERLWQ